MNDRAQVASDPIPALTGAAAVAVAILVGREIVAVQRQALAACAPDCRLGAPLPMGVGEAAFIAGVLLVAGGMVIGVGYRRRVEGSDE